MYKNQNNDLEVIVLSSDDESSVKVNSTKKGPKLQKSTSLNCTQNLKQSKNYINRDGHTFSTSSRKSVSSVEEVSNQSNHQKRPPNEDKSKKPSDEPPNKRMKLTEVSTSENKSVSSVASKSISQVDKCATQCLSENGVSESSNKIDNEARFKELLEFSKPFMNATDEKKERVIKDMMHIFKAADPSHTNSVSFRESIYLHKKNIQKNPEALFAYLQHLATELKSHKLKKEKHKGCKDKRTRESSPSNLCAAKPSTSSHTISNNGEHSKLSPQSTKHLTSHDSNADQPLKSTASSSLILNNREHEHSKSSLQNLSTSTSLASDITVVTKDDYTLMANKIDFPLINIEVSPKSCLPAAIASSAVVEESHVSPSPQLCKSSTSVECSTAGVATTSENSKTTAQSLEREKYIKKLEKLLGRLDRKIKKVQEKELNLDDLDDDQSSYIMEEKLKQKFMKTWKTLCAAKKLSAKVGRVTEKPIIFRGTRYDAVNKAIEKFVNKKKIFPDFTDICTVVNQVHSDIDLGLNALQLTELAKTIFEEVGSQLKQRRQRDFQQLLGCSLTDKIEVANDPADEDENLKSILEENDKVGSKRIQEVFDEYTMKQMELKDSVDKADSSASESGGIKSGGDVNNHEENDHQNTNDELPETDAMTSSSDDETPVCLISTSVQPLHSIAASLNAKEVKDFNNLEEEIIEILSNSDASTEPNYNAASPSKVETLASELGITPKTSSFGPANKCLDFSNKIKLLTEQSDIELTLIDSS